MARAPGPKGLPILGNTLEVWRDPLKLLTDAHREHGGVVRFRFGPYTYYLINDLDAIRRVLIDNAKNYVKSRNYDGLKLVLGAGLVTSEGELWRRQRRLIQPAFHKARVDAFVDPMAQLCESQTKLWDALPEGAAIDVHEAMTALTFRIVGRTLFDVDFGDDADRIGPVIRTLVHFANDWIESGVRVPTWLPTPRNLEFHRAKRVLDRIVSDMVDERRAAGVEKEDLLGWLMSATEDGRGMDAQQLRDEVITLISAGHETTANALSFAWYLLSLHPTVDRELVRELDAVLGGRSPTIDDLPKLELTDRIVRETMRLYPPAWALERMPLEEDELGGYRIEAGTTVGISAWTLHRDRAHWDDPEGFDPDRFLPERSKERPKLAYLPFGAGARQCIGMSMAITEAKIALAVLRQRYRLELVPGTRVELDPSVTLRPKNAIPMWLRRRDRAAVRPIVPRPRAEV